LAIAVKLEGLLSDAGQAGRPAEHPRNAGSQEGFSATTPDMGPMWNTREFDFNRSLVDSILNGDNSPVDLPPPQKPGFSVLPDDSAGGLGSFPTTELMGLGQFESLPPFEVIEEL
jgi:hypothetical protein